MVLENLAKRFNIFKLQCAQVAGNPNDHLMEASIGASHQRESLPASRVMRTLGPSFALTNSIDPQINIVRNPTWYIWGNRITFLFEIFTLKTTTHQMF